MGAREIGRKVRGNLNPKAEVHLIINTCMIFQIDLHFSKKMEAL